MVNNKEIVVDDTNEHLIPFGTDLTKVELPKIQKEQPEIFSDEHLTPFNKDLIEIRTVKEEEKQIEIDKKEEIVKKNMNISLNPFNWLKKKYGLDKNSDEDMEFVYTTYTNANELPDKISSTFYTVIVVIFTSFILWASIAEIDELARGMGKVIPTDKIQTVQSLDGGIISEIYVKEGKTVKQNDPLIKIDTTRYKATLEESKQEYLALLAVKTRLEIEAKIDINKPLPKPEFDKKIFEDSSRYDINEQMLLENRYKELKSSISVLQNQESQKSQELREIESNISKLKDSLGFIEEQRKTIKKLVSKGVKSNYDLLAIEREYAQTKGDLDTARVSISRSKYAITEAQGRINEKLNTFKSEASNELQKAVSQINKFEAKLVGDTDKVAKTTIVSPVDGIIKQLNFNTIGGVVQSGVDLIEIVPLSDVLVVEAKIDPKDIAFINPSQRAIVKITAYDFSIYGGLDAKIVDISADSIVDKESKEGKSYYRVLVKTNKNYLERNGHKLPIIPGMVASVDIITGKKTILDFILKPILKVKQDSFHER